MRIKNPHAPTEKDIENTILQFLSNHKIFVWKINCVGVYDSKRGVYRKPHSPFIISGICDILGIYKSRFLAIEVKVPKRKKNLTEHQENFINRINANGGLAFVATSIEDVKEKLDLLKPL